MIFKNKINKEDLNKIHNKRAYAIDAFITVENNMQDDWIILDNNYIYLITPDVDKEALNRLVYRPKKSYSWEQEFEKSGSIKGERKLINQVDNTWRKFVIYKIKIDNPNIIYRGAIDHIVNIDISSDVDKAVLLKKWEKKFPREVAKIQKQLKSQKFFQNGNVKSETDLDKIVRFANKSVNNYVRRQFEKASNDLYIDFDGIKYMLGASSPKRSLLHQLATYNDLNLLVNFVDANEDEIKSYAKTKEKNIQNENLKYAKEIVKYNLDNTILKAYNYYEDEIYVHFEKYNIHLAFKTDFEDWYDYLDKGDIIPKEFIMRYTDLFEKYE